MTAPVDYSLIIPAYNEGARLPCYLSSIKSYFDQLYKDRYEVIVVDDGSCDGLAVFLEGSCAAWPQLSFIRHLENEGHSRCTWCATRWAPRSPPATP